MIVRDQVLDGARNFTGLDDLGDVPFLEALDAFADALNHDPNVVDPVRDSVADMLTGLVGKRLRLVDDRKRNPGIADEMVTAPVFIVGQPRSGSTHLHALLGCVEGVRAPRNWEMSAPSPPPEEATYQSDPRIAAMQAGIDKMPPEILVRHPMSATRPEQCNGLFDWAFINQAWTASYDIPSYRDWFYAADYAPMYQAHHRTLQQLQWRAPGRWVLKYPKHLLSLDALLVEYPDAVFVWTHRDPVKVIPSVISLTGFMRSLQTPAYDPVRFGREWVTGEELALHRGLATRDRDDRPERHVDVDYPSLMRDPIATVAGLCERVGIPFGDGSRAAVQQWLDDNPRDQHGVHHYSAAEYGLDEDEVRARFEFYSRRFL
jgi:hypothetical protein